MVDDEYDTSSDTVIMILSSDWAQPHMDIFLPDVSAQALKSIQQSARTVVKKFMGNANTYWNISFAPVRLSTSKKEFINMVKVNNKEKQLLEKLFLEQSTSEDNKKSLWLINSLIAGLSNNTIESDLLDRECKEKISSLYKEVYLAQLDLEKELEASNTEWDKYLKNTSPDLPTRLSDYATVDILDAGLLKLYWSKLVTRLDKDQINNLKEWLRKNGSELTGYELRFKWEELF